MRREGGTQGSNERPFFYLGDSDGVIAELYSGAWTDYAYLGSERVAQITGTTPNYYFGDHLGSTALLTDASGNNTLGAYPHKFTAFGMDQPGVGVPTDRRRYTGKERDAESQLDYFGARYYFANLGRFGSPDAFRFSNRQVERPQRWSEYPYVLDNPLSLYDPNGLDDDGLLSKFFGMFFVRGSVGVGLEAKAHLGPAGFSVGAAMRSSGTAHLNGDVSVKANREVSAKAAVGNLEAAVVHSTEHTTVEGNKALGLHKVETSNSAQVGQASVSKDEVSVGAEVGAVFLMGGEAGIDLSKASDFVNTLAATMSSFASNMMFPPMPMSLPCTPTTDTTCTGQDTSSGGGSGTQSAPADTKPTS